MSSGDSEPPRAAASLFRRRAAWVAIAVGVALRVVSIPSYVPEYDAYLYATDAADGFSAIWTGLPNDNLPRTPLFTTIVWLLAELPGGLQVGLDAASLLTSLAVIPVVFFVSRNLWGERVALGSTILVSLDPVLVFLTGYRYSENLALTLFTLTLWAIIRSLRQPPYIVWAGVFAALAYLARSSLGPFFFLAAALGVLWRLRYGTKPGGSPLSAFNRYYVAGGLIFLSVVGIWAAHNIALTGRFTSNASVSLAVAAVIDRPLAYAAAWIVKTTFVASVFLAYALYFAPWLKKSLQKARHDELESGLWVAAISVLLTGGTVAAAFFLIEANPLLWFDNVRYASPALVPLAWLALRDPSAAPRTLARPTGAALGVYFALVTYASRAWTVAMGIGQAIVGFTKWSPLRVLAVVLALLSAGTAVFLGPATTHPGRADGLEAIQRDATPGQILTILPDPGGSPGRALVIRTAMAEYYAPAVEPRYGTQPAGDWVLGFQPLDSPDYRLHSVHHDATGWVGEVLDRSTAFGIRNADTYVYQRAT